MRPPGHQPTSARRGQVQCGRQLLQPSDRRPARTWQAHDSRSGGGRFAAAGITSIANEALASLKRCKPARAQIYRDGDVDALDPHDDEVDFWLFRLGLRPARSAPLRVAPNPSTPLPSADQPLMSAPELRACVRTILDELE